MIINDIHLNELKSPNQTIKARVEIYKGFTLEKICTCEDILSEFTIERAGEGKFFGYGICQKLRVNLIDIDRELNITKENSFKVAFGVNDNFIYPFPTFFVEDVERDETTNSLSVTAYDFLYKAENHTVEELNLPNSYTPFIFASAIGACFGSSLNVADAGINAFYVEYPEGANVDGTENLRYALNAIAEATQTIYFVNKAGALVFKQLKKDAEAALTIEKNDYISFSNRGPAVLSKLVHVTELGDNVAPETEDPEQEAPEQGIVEPETATEGVIQYVRNNPFWELREDIYTLVDNAQAAVEGISINQFECEWIGNYLLEIGDKVTLVAEDNSVIDTYILDDSITFDGTLLEHMKWEYEANDSETAANPSSLGEALNQTFARVDKINQEITLHAGNIEENLREISILKVTTDGISTKVTKVEEVTNTQVGALNAEINGVKTQVSELQVDSEKALLEFKTTIEKDGVTKVSGTGFLFDETGLSINKEGSKVSTTITEDGMKINRNHTEVLVADNQGVKAEDLHATTYLIIGNNSRLEDFGSDRTGCFWIGD